MKPTPQQVEAAAHAIYQQFANRSGRARDWSALPANLKDDYRAEAEAALEAASQIRSN